MNIMQTADNTSTLCTGNSIADIKMLRIKTLEKIHEIFNASKLVLNVDKTEIIVFGEDNSSQKFIYRNETVCAKELAKYLRVLVDKNLTFPAKLKKCLTKWLFQLSQ